jgi:hypothetical protein
VENGQAALKGMTSRPMIAAGFVVLSGAALWGILAQGRQVSELRAEQERLKSANRVQKPAAASVVPASPMPGVPRELLQLRAEVARLSQQQRELAGARPENEKLRLQLENRRTNNAAGKGAAPGYIRMSEVKWLGCNTPEDTLQSAFWATQKRDWEKYLETIRPDVAKELVDSLRAESRSADEFFKDKRLPPIFIIAGRQQNDEEFINLQVEIAPDTPALSIIFRRVGGQWKLESSF